MKSATMGFERRFASFGFFVSPICSTRFEVRGLAQRFFVFPGVPAVFVPPPPHSPACIPRVGEPPPQQNCVKVFSGFSGVGSEGGKNGGAQKRGGEGPSMN